MLKPYTLCRNLQCCVVIQGAEAVQDAALRRADEKPAPLVKALLVPALDADGAVKLLLKVVEPSPQPEAAPPSKVGPTLEQDAANRDADGDVEMAAAERLASGQAASTSGRAAVPGDSCPWTVHSATHSALAHLATDLLYQIG